MENEKEIQQLKNRFRDLADKSFSQNMFTFTGFLGLAEQDIFWRMERELSYAGITVFGGAHESDRKMVRFGSEKELGYSVEFPIVCVHMKPVLSKFADDFSHRDFLGALMNLGIDRSTLGDILVGDREAYLFCLDSISGFICENLTQVRHTHIRCEVVANWKEIPKREPEVVVVQVASLRVDALIAKIYQKSRESCLELFRTQKVYVDGRLCENNSRLLKAGETVNARGYGKFWIQGDVRETRKGKLAVTAAVYR